MEDNIVKSITIILFFVDTLVFGNLPYLLTRRSASNDPKSVQFREKVISYFNCFAGGVFLGACLVHLLVEGRETLLEYFELVSCCCCFPVNGEWWRMLILFVGLLVVVFFSITAKCITSLWFCRLLPKFGRMFEYWHVFWRSC